MNPIVLSSGRWRGRTRRPTSVAERLGFTLEGVEHESLRTGDAVPDAAVYSLLEEEWLPGGI